MNSSKIPLILFIVVIILLAGGIIYMYKFPRSATKYTTTMYPSPSAIDMS